MLQRLWLADLDPASDAARPRRDASAIRQAAPDARRTGLPVRLGHPGRRGRCTSTTCALALIRLGHEAVILAPVEDEDALPDYVTSGGKPISISSNGSVAKINFGPIAAARARRWVKESDLDILHVHEPAGPTLSILSIWVSEGPIVATWHASLASSRRELNATAPIVRSAMEKIRARIAVSASTPGARWSSTPVATRC